MNVLHPTFIIEGLYGHFTNSIFFHNLESASELSHVLSITFLFIGSRKGGKLNSHQYCENLDTKILAFFVLVIPRHVVINDNCLKKQKLESNLENHDVINDTQHQKKSS